MKTNQVISHYDALAHLPYREGYLAKEDVQRLKDELFFQRARADLSLALPVA